MLYFFIIIFVVGIDQSTKYLAQTILLPVNSVPLVQGIFHLTYARNTGAAFSILQDTQIILIPVTGVIIVGIICYMIKIRNKRNVLLKLSLALISGGALGNFIDRVRLGYVTDFFDFTLISYPIFNFADVFVVLGVILLAYIVLIKGNLRSIND